MRRILRSFFLGGTVITGNLYIWHIKLMPRLIAGIYKYFPKASSIPNLTAITLDQTFFPASICFSYLWFVSFFEVRLQFFSFV